MELDLYFVPPRATAQENSTRCKTERSLSMRKRVRKRQNDCYGKC